jgi:adenylate kinase family enzyme
MTAPSQPTRRPPDRIHTVGASGSETTSLAAEIAGRYGHRHLDTPGPYGTWWKPRGFEMW